DSLVAESRELPAGGGLDARAGGLVDALVQGPAHGGLAVLPAGTAVLHAYLDDRGQLTLDLSRAFRQGFRGGSRAEELAVGSLVRTLAANLPDVKRVLIVCGGAPLGSLGGHVPLDQPLDPHDWP
ncbi:MAG TPA: GerMN domain-containing protein, partial [Candidatus Eisenbacteria bacterium]|nr:GerMN domain-containing protein [Candidatus Eisenbacteria bacterium]